MFEIQKLFHLTQVVDDLDAADRWYNRLFSPCRFYRGYMKEAFRTASLLAIGEAAVVEPVAVSAEPGGAESPLGRFKARFGPRLHSVAWYVDDLEATVESLLGNGVRLVDIAGRSITAPGQVSAIKYVWTHPRDSHGALEFSRLDPAISIDPRVQPHWSPSYWETRHPLALRGPLRIVMAVRDPAAAARFYETVLSARPTTALPWQPGRSFRVGPDTVVDLVDSTHPRLAGFGEGVFGMGFQLADVGQAERFVAGLGLRPRALGDGAFELGPDQALGTTVAFLPYTEH